VFTRNYAWGNAHTELVVLVVYAAIQRDCRACRALVTFLQCHKTLATITNQIADSEGVCVILVHTHLAVPHLLVFHLEIVKGGMKL